MQVKISFTVDLDDVPREVDKALVEAMKTLEEITDGHLSPVKKENVLQTMNWLDRTRKQLLRVDTRMLECYSMLAGYNKALADSYMPQQEQQEAEEQQHVES